MRPSVRGLRRGAALLVVIVTVAAILVLERADRGLVEIDMPVGETPATLTYPDREGVFPLVVVAHGFAGSRQMMQPARLTLARSGMAVLAFDFVGHGRNPARLSPDVASLDGTTADLVAETRAVARAGLDHPRTRGPVAFLGHSMATDVIVRAARGIGAEDVVAISTYSEAITPEAPRRLLLVSGQWEGHLRATALEALRMVAPDAREGETARSGAVERRAAVAPLVGHVGVLWSATMLSEARDWLAPQTGALAAIGVPLAVALAGLVILAHLLVPEAGAPRPAARLSAGRFWLAVALPILPAIAAALVFRPAIAGIAGFASIAAFLAVWGAVQLAVLRPARNRIGGTTAFLLLWALLFALVLDRYGAAFLPTGPRVELLVALLPGTLPAMLADGWIVRHAAPWQWILARVALIGALMGAMLLAPERLGLLFTILPVAVLFFLVYGGVARRLGRRRGSTGPALAMGLILAWAIAASTPIFAG